ncbi:hypothetical protein [Alkalihalobacterium chitinilyticum]|uniref:Uncharacterized protein n=1 Tax=Alkalihalobacterium chitinilyticum TaxID=2980103 RepID=A0ABT5VCN3_9BACI|nr:hypothetical protein [Alkalihalobacterium chitinilyticum]MDE5413212.1 hypothetical protein [Alkalihalobacterium chitinilyticum]
MSEFNPKKKEDQSEPNHETHDENVDLSGILNIATNLLKNTNADSLNTLSKLASNQSLNSLNGLLDELATVEQSNEKSDNVNKIISSISTIINETSLIDNLSTVQNQENNDLKKLESKLDQILEELADIKVQLDKVKSTN